MALLMRVRENQLHDWMDLDGPDDGSNHFQFEVLFPWLVKHNLELTLRHLGEIYYFPIISQFPSCTEEKVSGERGD